MNIEEKRLFVSQKIELLDNLQTIRIALEAVDNSDMDDVSKINAKYAICVAGDLATSVFKAIQNNQIQGTQNIFTLVDQNLGHLRQR